MAKEDLLLPVEMGKLEIEPVKSNKCIKEENPFNNKTQQKISFTPKGHLLQPKCSCSLQKSLNHMTICKKKNSKVIKDPVLKILQSRPNNQNSKEETQSGSRKFNSSVSQNLNSDILNLCALVDNCNQLRISSDIKKQNMNISQASNKNEWWKNDISQARQIRKSGREQSQAGTCSQQALNPPCDVTIDELASYFETLVHIPKKMSSMAEMMYI